MFLRQSKAILCWQGHAKLQVPIKCEMLQMVLARQAAAMPVVFLQALQPSGPSSLARPDVFGLLCGSLGKGPNNLQEFTHR